jgi:hypothetical protein
MRLSLFGGAALTTALTVTLVATHPGILHGGMEVVVYLGMLGVGLALVVVAALVGTRAGGEIWRGAARDGCRWQHRHLGT